jgi:hypothetical protein
MENKKILLNPASVTSTIGSAFLAWDNSLSNIVLIAPSTTSVKLGTASNSSGLTVSDSGVYASPFLSTANLQCSSINGAAPGGGGSVPANLGVSTLTISDQPTAGGGTLVIEASDSDLYSFSVSTLAGFALGTIGGRNQLYADTAEMDDLMVSSITAVAGANVQVVKPMAVSSIIGVSTINGVAYPPPAPTGITRTTISTLGGGTTILGDGSTVIVTNNFTTLAGHLYTLSGWLYAAASANISSNSSLALQIGNIDRAYQSAIPLWGYSPAGATAFGNNIPVSFTWRADSGAVNNVINAQMVDALGTAVSTVINSPNGLLLVDYGAVA